MLPRFRLSKPFLHSSKYAIPKRNFTVALQDLKPPETPEYCCGNSCKNCVWDLYFEELNKYNELKSQLEKKEDPKKQTFTENQTNSLGVHVSTALLTFQLIVT